MNAQFYAVPGGPVETVFGQPLRMENLAGEFAVVEGRVWLTRRGDLDDHVLSAGAHVVLEPGDDVVVENWAPGEPARLRWSRRYASPRGERLLRDAFGAGLRFVAEAALGSAAGLRRAGGGLEALARNAASMARRAQGCIAV